jgi:hypothetical protein
MLWVSNLRRDTVEKARALLNVRDINLIRQYYKTYAQIEGVTRRRKITRAALTKWHLGSQNSSA